MTESQEREIRTVVQDEILGILTDAQEHVGIKKDPTGMARKALEGLANLVRSRKDAAKSERA